MKYKHTIRGMITLCLLLMLIPASGKTILREFPENDSLISALTGQVNADSIENYMYFLQNMGTRFLLSEDRRDVAAALAAKFEEMGTDAVRLDSFFCHTDINMGSLNFDTVTLQYNVVASIFGMLDSESYYIMGAHYDDVVFPYGDPMELAPGADDNASGVAALLETARILSENEYQPMHTLELVAFAAEELMYSGYSGGQAYVDTALAYGKEMRMMINNDMIAYSHDDAWEIKISNYVGSEVLSGIGVEVTDNYTNITPVLDPLTDQAGADAKYFFEAGVPTIYFMEKDFNPNYHTTEDLVENALPDYCAEATKISIGVIVMADDTLLTGSRELYSEESFRIFPNPTNGKISIVADHQQQHETSCTLFGADGRIVFEKSIVDELMVDLSDLPAGLYFCRFSDGRKSSVQKIILNR